MRYSLKTAYIRTKLNSVFVDLSRERADDELQDEVLMPGNK
jgi:hypothetical protein